MLLGQEIYLYYLDQEISPQFNPTRHLEDLTEEKVIFSNVGVCGTYTVHRSNLAPE